MTDRWSWAGRPADQLVLHCREAALSLCWATNPLPPLPVTALTSWSHTGTTVTCSWQKSAPSQRSVLAASWGSKKLRACKGWVAEGWRINLSWELAMWFVTACYSLTWFSLHRPPAVSTLSSRSFNATSWSFAPHLCSTSSSLLISSCITSFFVPFPLLFLYLSTNSLYFTPPFVHLKITQQSLSSVIYACQNTTPEPRWICFLLIRLWI